MENFRKKAAKALPYIAAPFAVMAIILVCYQRRGIFPFGKGTVAWCDMSQQVIPLLCDLKDMLSGKAGIFLNLQNAGGMNMWGVIFFFLASPFSLLVMFVKKVDMIYFANILVMLKLMTCSVTSVFFLRRRMSELPKLWCVTLSILYAFSGYAMLYYQNVIWLDMMYLFPLLMWSFGELIDKKRVAPYTTVLTLMMVVNYYISYMVVIFTLMFMGIVCFRYREQKKYRQSTVYFIIGSALGAFLSAVVWLPCFAQYLSSGRKESLFSQIKTTTFFASYETTLTTIFLSVSVLIFTVICVVDGRPRSKRQNTYLLLAFLMVIPLLVEPVNMMWHTGTYMSFPSRYGFITQYLLICCAALFITDKTRIREERKKCDSLPLLIVLMVILYSFTRFTINFSIWNEKMLSAYTRSLWCDKDSFHAMMQLGLMACIVYGGFFVIHRKGFISKEVFSSLCAVIIIAEAFSNASVYLTMPQKNYPKRAQEQRLVMDLADRIQDNGGFYRVATDKKSFEVNLMGSMGYNSMSHYTSLTSQDYMFMMKKLGYSSYWMEVGSYGGTGLTDALMNIKYRIKPVNKVGDRLYSNKRYAIVEEDNYMPSGLVTDKDLSKADELPKMTRAQLQQYLYENTIGEQNDALVTEYEPDTPGIAKADDNGIYNFKLTDKQQYTMTYTIEVKGRQALYFDCFDKTSNSLREKINDSFSVYVNYKQVESSYPSQSSNGLVYLGEFNDEVVDVSIRVLKNCKCSSFGVFSLDQDKLETAVAGAKTVDFKDNNGTLTGKYTADEGDSCLLSIPYSEDLKVQINGEAVQYQKVFDDMVLIKLKKGENNIRITSMPKGFLLGAVMSIMGVGLCVAYFFLRKKIKVNDTMEKISFYAIVGAGAAAVIMVYIVPVIVNFRN